MQFSAKKLQNNRLSLPLESWHSPRKSWICHWRCISPAVKMCTAVANPGFLRREGLITRTYYGVFTLTDTDKMDLQPICICVGVGQCEQFCILNPFFTCVCVCIGQCEHTIIWPNPSRTAWKLGRGPHSPIHHSNFFKMKQDFRPLRRIGKNQPCMNRIQLQPQISTENIVV